MLLAACSSSDSDDSPIATSQNEICLTTNVTSMPSGTRATTIDNNTALQGKDLKIDAYYHGTDTKFLDGKTLHYDSSEPAGWKFWNTGSSSQEHYYWPFVGSTVAGSSTVASTLDFVGFCPYSPTSPTPDYIASSGYTHGSGASFTCDMSSYMTLASQSSMQEFLVSVLPNQTLATQDDAGGALPMVFKHPFALIKFVITEASGTHVKINSVSIADLKTSGTCTYNGTAMTWSEQSASNAMTMTIVQELKRGGTTETTPFVVIPNNYGSKTLTVNATWDDWSNVTMDVTANVDFNWEPGKIYTYNLTLAKYILIVDTQKYTEQW